MNNSKTPDSIIFNSSFESVESDKNLTDYNLEFSRYEPSRKRSCLNNNNINKNYHNELENDKKMSPTMNKNRQPFKDLPKNKNTMKNSQFLPKIGKRKLSLYDDNLMYRERSDDDSLDEENQIILPRNNKIAKLNIEKSESEDKFTLPAPPPLPANGKSNKRKQNRPKKSNTKLAIDKHLFYHFITNIFENYNVFYTKEAILALHESAELYMRFIFEDAYQFCLHQNRRTLCAKDIRWICQLRRGFQ